MPKTLALLHTGAFLAPFFTQLVKQQIPGVQVFNMVDESLINNTIAANRLTPDTYRRLAQHLASAEDAGADLVLVTCSSVGPAVEAARPFVNIPIIRVDEPMADEAVRIACRAGGRVGVIATLQTTLEPTTDLIRDRAQAQGRAVEIVSYLCENAFAALRAGDGETHDRIVMAGLRALMTGVDVIVLAQASMARVADALPEGEKLVPILASPAFGVEAARRALAEMG